MKSVAAAIAIATLLAFSPTGDRAGAQTPQQAATPAPAVTTSPALASEARSEKRTPARGKRSWERPDARVCLEFPNNLQIIKCAEKYRTMRGPA